MLGLCFVFRPFFVRSPVPRKAPIQSDAVSKSKSLKAKLIADGEKRKHEMSNWIGRGGGGGGGGGGLRL